MQTKACSISGFEGLYLINSDGSIYSVRKKRLLIPRENSGLYPYLYVCLTGHNGQHIRTGIHRIIAHHFIGPQPSARHEVNHKDLNKFNNEASNLEWITHQQNILHARRVNNWKSGRKPGFTISDSTRHKMSIKKLKRVLLFNDSQEVICKSVYEAMDYLHTYRRKINKYANTNKLLNGFKIKILD